LKEPDDDLKPKVWNEENTMKRSRTTKNKKRITY